ncbi:putative feruloyl esterase B precursor [Talaromyces proteolyticus]|uniref:Carboxylic ester hydrolase n=1 Tax=Talaromyces proteolyticus TaxID=1131652 RepID=A0AAD4PY34_9EURO|nr:putative feruloyl esterase B precursor [Talaromyces proteolyticus]KAH8694195.1 putative feruloyl esterase B precursor [Talaromyces proteolyticus]
MKFIHFASLFSVWGIVNVSSQKHDCSSLASTQQAKNAVQILTAIEVLPGSLNLSSNTGEGSIKNKFQLCQVQGIIKYQANPRNGKVEFDVNGNDTITWELFLPDPENYNGRFLAVGNGGFAGTIDNSTMLENTNSGYAVSGCDSGHSLTDSENGIFLEDLGKTKTWIHDSIVMTTQVTRDIVAKYYARSPKYSYYSGCSTGGAQGYSLAQYHPELFDGIYAGSPGNWYSHLVLSFLWNGLHSTSGGYLSQQVLNFITDNVLAACDDIDGVKDGVIGNPLKCHFDIMTLECKQGQNLVNSSNRTLCLTSDQLQAAQAIYAGPKDSRDYKEVYPGFDLGSENAWLTQESVLYVDYTTPILQKLVFKNDNYNVSTFNWGSDIDRVDSIASPLIDAITPDLSAFNRRGGKLISTQGWADPYNAAAWPIQHLGQIQSALKNTNINNFIRLFMVPGGGHCGANPLYRQVPATYHVLDPLVRWVEKGQKPEEILSSSPPDGSNTTRKLCPWPKVARFTGGDQSNWQSYECV